MPEQRSVRGRVIYESRGTTHELARAVLDGIADVAGADPWGRPLDEAEKDDLPHCDALILGSPNWSGITGKLKDWLGYTGDLWETGELAGKVGGCFTAGWSRSGGTETTLLQLLHLLLAHGMVFVGLPWTETMRESGSYYGATAHGEVREIDREKSRALGVGLPNFRCSCRSRRLRGASDALAPGTRHRSMRAALPVHRAQLRRRTLWPDPEELRRRRAGEMPEIRLDDPGAPEELRFRESGQRGRRHVEFDSTSPFGLPHDTTVQGELFEPPGRARAGAVIFPCAFTGINAGFEERFYARVASASPLHKGRSRLLENGQRERSGHDLLQATSSRTFARWRRRSATFAQHWAGWSNAAGPLASGE